MTPLTHDLRRAIRYQLNVHARQALALGQTTRINDLELLVALGKLTDNEREAWIDTNVLGHTSQVIAKRMGLHRSTVGKLERAATTHLIARLGRTDFIDRWAPLEDAA